MIKQVKISKLVLISWAWVEAMRLLIYGIAIIFDPAPKANINYKVHQSLLPLHDWGVIMVVASLVMIGLLCCRKVYLVKLALTISATISTAWASAFAIVALTEPQAVKFAWINWTALALADLLAVRMPIFEALNEER